MTPEQKDIFIKALQHGFSSGACHRYECLQSYIRWHPEQKDQAIAAFAAFERGCCHSPEGQIYLENMTDEDFYQIAANYQRQFTTA